MTQPAKNYVVMDGIPDWHTPVPSAPPTYASIVGRITPASAPPLPEYLNLVEETDPHERDSSIMAHIMSIDTFDFKSLTAEQKAFLETASEHPTTVEPELIDEQTFYDKALFIKASLYHLRNNYAEASKLYATLLTHENTSAVVYGFVKDNMKHLDSSYKKSITDAVAKSIAPKSLLGKLWGSRAPSKEQEQRAQEVLNAEGLHEDDFEVVTP